jgi:hypothetical protein
MALGRGAIRGPGLQNFDFSLFKNGSMLGEKIKVQFRFEAFNIFNRANFGSGFVRIFHSNGQPIPSVNTLSNFAMVTTSRQIQFGVKFVC